MKKKELFKAVESLNSVSELKGVKFAYTTLKNKKKIEEEIKFLEEVVKPSDKFLEYEQERIQLCNQFADKNEDGSPVIENNQFKIQDMDTFNKKLENLKKSYDGVLEEREKQIFEYNSMIDEEVGIEFTKLNLNDLPTDISAEQLEKIDFMVNFD